MTSALALASKPRAVSSRTESAANFPGALAAALRPLQSAHVLIGGGRHERALKLSRLDLLALRPERVVDGLRVEAVAHHFANLAVALLILLSVSVFFGGTLAGSDCPLRAGRARARGRRERRGARE